MSIFERITREIHNGMILFTPVYKKPFKIEVDPDKSVFFVGDKTSIPIPKAIWNDIPDFLRDRWVIIGAKFGVPLKGSLQDYIDNHPSRGTQHSADANYVASVLDHLKIVDVKRSKPSAVKLKGKSR
jgi:hypothetical protein